MNAIEKQAFFEANSSREMLLPEVLTKADYKKIRADASVWLPAMHAICSRHGLDKDDLRHEPLGTHVIFHTGKAVVKLFCPLWREDFVAERAALTQISGLPTPVVIAQGELGGWPYLVMTSLPGIPAGSIWKTLQKEAKLSVLRQLGQLMRQLHRQSLPKELAVDWDAFLYARITQAEEHHATTDSWRYWIRERIADFSEPPFIPVLLNADITDDHVLLSENGGKWQITGLVDFGDAMLGHRYYEFIAPLACFAFGTPVLSRELITAYGLELTPDLAQQITTYCLLHQFGRLEDFLTRHKVYDGAEFFEALWGEM